jgi:hypothetical protein
MLNPAAIPSPSLPAPASRKHLSCDPLLRIVHERAKELFDARTRDGSYSVADAVMSAIAMFSLKDPSLLAFQGEDRKSA